jgi:gas vesicle protein
MLGLALGVAAGAAAGLLFAPARGSDVRHSLRTRAHGTNATLQSYATSVKSWAGERIKSLRESNRPSEPVRSVPMAGPSLTATVGEIASARQTPTPGV